MLNSWLDDDTQDDDDDVYLFRKLKTWGEMKKIASRGEDFKLTS